jgi:steroid 5-alpha reductase family enzyme
MLATQRANSPAAMMASMILMSLLLICISGCKGTNKCEKNKMLFEI